MAKAASRATSSFGWQLEVGHQAAVGAQQVVVVAGQVLGQLEAGELVDGHDAPDHAGLGQHGQGAVGRALGQGGVVLEDLGDGQGSPGDLEGVDHRRGGWWCSAARPRPAGWRRWRARRAPWPDPSANRE